MTTDEQRTEHRLAPGGCGRRRRRQRPTRPTVRWAGLAGAVALVCGAAAVSWATVASAATVDGVATIADPLTQAALASGGSVTQFTVVLPANAACSGDSAHDGYRVFSYLVKKGTDVTSITFPSNLPDTTDDQFGLVDPNATYYGDVNTAQTTGQIIGIPNDFEFAPLVTSDQLLPTLLYTGGSSGVWEAGLACTNGTGTVTDFWNTEVTFTSSTSDANGFVWSAVPGDPSSSTTTTTTTAGSGSTTTTGAGATTTTTGSSDVATTTTAPTVAAGVTGPDDGTGGDAGSGTGTDAGAGTTGAGDSGLAFTGIPVARDIGIGLLLVGAGLMLASRTARRRVLGTVTSRERPSR